MEHPAALNEDFNLSTAESTTVLELAEMIWTQDQRRGRAVPLVHDDAVRARRAARVPSVDKARDVLGFEATTTLDEMLDEVIPWISQAIEQGTI